MTTTTHITVPAAPSVPAEFATLNEWVAFCEGWQVCHRCGDVIEGEAVQNLAGWEGRQLAIERGRWYHADTEACLALKWGLCVEELRERLGWAEPDCCAEHPAGCGTREHVRFAEAR